MEVNSGFLSKIRKVISPTYEEKLEKLYEDMANNFIENNLYLYKVDGNDSRVYYGRNSNPFLYDRKNNNSSDIDGDLKAALNFSLEHGEIDPFDLLNNYSYKDEINYRERLDNLEMKPSSFSFKPIPDFNPYLKGFDYSMDLDDNENFEILDNVSGDINSSFAEGKKYLTNQGIDAELVTILHSKGLLQQDHRNNLISVWNENGHEVGRSEIGMTEGSDWKKVHSNSNQSVGFNIRNGDPESIKVFDNNLEMLSYMTLNKDTMENSWFVSLEGTNEDVINHHVTAAKESSPESLNNVTFLLSEGSSNQINQLVSPFKDNKEQSDLKVEIILPQTQSWSNDLREAINEFSEVSHGLAAMDI